MVPVVLQGEHGTSLLQGPHGGFAFENRGCSRLLSALLVRRGEDPELGLRGWLETGPRTHEIKGGLLVTTHTARRGDTHTTWGHVGCTQEQSPRGGGRGRPTVTAGGDPGFVGGCDGLV